MKKYTLLFVFCFGLSISEAFSNKIIDPLRSIKMDELEWSMDNPKGKLKIRFVRTEDKSDTTNRPKGFFGKLKNIVNMIMDASENPPFKIEIVREKEKEKRN